MSTSPSQIADSDEVTCVMVPLNEQTLLIPNVCVAEVVPWRRTKKLTSVPAWCVGVLGWRGESVVVLDYESILDPERRPAAKPRFAAKQPTPSRHAPLRGPRGRLDGSRDGNLSRAWRASVFVGFVGVTR